MKIFIIRTAVIFLYEPTNPFYSPHLLIRPSIGFQEKLFTKNRRTSGYGCENRQDTGLVEEHHGPHPGDSPQKPVPTGKMQRLQ
jgi:hypothetical protein